MPLVLIKDAYEKGPVRTGDYYNQKITFIQRACDPDVAHGEGRTGYVWWGAISSVRWPGSKRSRYSS